MEEFFLSNSVYLFSVFVGCQCQNLLTLNVDSGGGSSLGSKLKSLSPDSFVKLLQEIFKIVQVMYARLSMVLLHDLFTSSYTDFFIRFYIVLLA